jgi:glycosyltransferase involved in cell wall biosynthesis
MERVGVVIPLYNHEAFVGEAVRSVLGQTVDGVELVVVDDGSRDGSVAAARAAIAEFPGRRARLIEQENRGAHAAIMRGFAELDTPVCAVLNSDDLYETKRFERMVPALAGPLAIAFSALCLIDDRGRTLPADHAWSRWYAAALTAAETEPTIGFGLLVHNFSVTSGNFVFTRALYDRLEGFGNQKFAHDWDFLMRSVALTEPVFVPDKLMRYRVHATNTTESVRHSLDAECAAALTRYARTLRAASRPNPIAPCAQSWPSYWGRFCNRRRAFWGSLRSEHPARTIVGD